MSKEHIIHRVIDGIHCQCRDTGCDNFDRAEFNRYLITNGSFSTGYVLVEEAVEHTPWGRPLASWIPQGELVKVGKKDWEQYSGGQDGGYIVGEFRVVGNMPETPLTLTSVLTWTETNQPRET